MKASGFVAARVLVQARAEGAQMHQTLPKWASETFPNGPPAGEASGEYREREVIF